MQFILTIDIPETTGHQKAVVVVQQALLRAGAGLSEDSGGEGLWIGQRFGLTSPVHGHLGAWIIDPTPECTPEPQTVTRAIRAERAQQWGQSK